MSTCDTAISLLHTHVQQYGGVGVYATSLFVAMDMKALYTYVRRFCARLFAVV